MAENEKETQVRNLQRMLLVLLANISDLENCLQRVRTIADEMLGGLSGNQKRQHKRSADRS